MPFGDLLAIYDNCKVWPPFKIKNIREYFGSPYKSEEKVVDPPSGHNLCEAYLTQRSPHTCHNATIQAVELRLQMILVQSTSKSGKISGNISMAWKIKPWIYFHLSLRKYNLVDRYGNISVRITTTVKAIVLGIMRSISQWNRHVSMSNGLILQKCHYLSTQKQF